jgi:hypothetical protein
VYRNPDAVLPVLYHALRAIPPQTNKSGLYVRRNVLEIADDEQQPTTHDIDVCLELSEYERTFSYKRPLSVLRVLKEELDETSHFTTFSFSVAYRGFELQKYMHGSYLIDNTTLKNFEVKTADF